MSYLRAMIALGLSLFSGAKASAQERSHSVLSPGQVVRVWSTRPNFTALEGRIERIANDTLQLSVRVPTSMRSFSSGTATGAALFLGDAERIDLRVRRSRSPGALKGAVAGALVGAIVGGIWSRSRSRANEGSDVVGSWTFFPLVAPVLTTVTGVIAGTALGSMSVTERWRTVVRNGAERATPRE